ncbi:protein FAM3C-like [Sebastes fasciatus]|uniref:protein FAM3C-like n=1 Tax=Sebastes fasciatus TaxID=394691 RepID=UPI003D9ECE6A
MLTVRVGRIKMARQNTGKILRFILVLVPLVVFITFILQKYSSPFNGDLLRALAERSEMPGPPTKAPSKAGSCTIMKDCPEDYFSFFVQSGAANVLPPKICVQNKLVVGSVLNNAGLGINVVILNGKTGDVLKTAHFDMFGGDVKPFIELLKTIETGSVVLMASYDEPSTKLTKDARELIAQLGSTSVKSLGFRDNWVFVGGKGASVQSNFEKYMKNDNTKNKYDNWPEIIELHGCIPKYLE